MTRGSVLKIVNIALGVLFLNQVVTALLSDVLPEEAFEILHEGGGTLLVVAVVLHVALNWGWVRNNLLRKATKPKA